MGLTNARTARTQLPAWFANDPARQQVRSAAALPDPDIDWDAYTGRNERADDDITENDMGQDFPHVTDDGSTFISWGNPPGWRQQQQEPPRSPESGALLNYQYAVDDDDVVDGEVIGEEEENWVRHPSADQGNYVRDSFGQLAPGLALRQGHRPRPRLNDEDELQSGLSTERNATIEREAGMKLPEILAGPADEGSPFEDRPYGFRSFCRQLGRSPVTVRQALSSGRLPPVGVKARPREGFAKPGKVPAWYGDGDVDLCRPILHRTAPG